ncbi:Protein of unknown function [Gryllus bimaculatus]|nr:Protein of unknown function [Gryllus bimaculatus]
MKEGWVGGRGRECLPRGAVLRPGSGPATPGTLPDARRAAGRAEFVRDCGVAAAAVVPRKFSKLSKGRQLVVPPWPSYCRALGQGCGGTWHVAGPARRGSRKQREAARLLDASQGASSFLYRARAEKGRLGMGSGDRSETRRKPQK